MRLSTTWSTANAWRSPTCMPSHALSHPFMHARAPDSSLHGSPPPKYSGPSPSERSEPHSQGESQFDPPTAGPVARTHVSAFSWTHRKEGEMHTARTISLLSETEKKKPAHGAGSSRLISDDAPVSPLAKQPKFEKARNSCMNESTK